MRDLRPYFYIFAFLLAALLALLLLWETGADKRTARRSAEEPSVPFHVRYSLLSDGDTQGVDRHSL